MLEEKMEFKAASELYQKALSLKPDSGLRKLIEHKSKREPGDQRDGSVLDKILRLLK